MELAAGRFTERVTLMVRNEARTASGATVMGNAEAYADRWASVVPRMPRRFEQLQTVYSEMVAAYTVRGYVDVRVGHLIQHSGRLQEVIGIETADNRPPLKAHEITLMVKGFGA